MTISTTSNRVVVTDPFGKPYVTKKVQAKKDTGKPSVPIVKFVPVGTPGSTSIGLGSCFWNRKLCRFQDDNSVHYLNRYREWFFTQLDADLGNSLNMTLSVFEQAILTTGTILLACDQHDRCNHGTIIKEYLEWSIAKRVESKKVPPTSPFLI